MNIQWESWIKTFNRKNRYTDNYSYALGFVLACSSIQIELHGAMAVLLARNGLFHDSATSPHTHQFSYFRSGSFIRTLIMENQNTAPVYRASNPTSSGTIHDRTSHPSSETKRTNRTGRWKDDRCDLLVIRLVRSHRPYRISLTAVVISFRDPVPWCNVEEIAVETPRKLRQRKYRRKPVIFFLFSRRIERFGDSIRFVD